MKNIPNLITLANLFAGCLSVILIARGFVTEGAVLIVACSLLDFLDGAAARWLNAYSAIGKQLDSLADLVSFGFAPAAVLFYYLRNSFDSINHQGTLFVLSSAAFLITLCSAVRLARFNLDEKQTDCFTGLPTPANALLIASLPLTLAFADQHTAMHHILSQVTQHSAALLFLTGILSYLLVSPFSMFSLKVRSFSWKGNRTRVVFLTGCIVLLITFGWGALPLFLVFYILLSLIGSFFFPCERNETTSNGQ
ncbi:MAG: CDP-diacylglycerol--serine O-phosphatidyltransferase [Bacteroidales bacterium]|nr:CDP-diacylglycerol--serine O-phosphatidyltransferase [Bacteroidales bacterium]